MLQADGSFRLFAPFRGPWNFIGGLFTAVVLIMVFTSLLYFFLHRYFLKDKRRSDSSVDSVVGSSGEFSADSSEFKSSGENEDEDEEDSEDDSDYSRRSSLQLTLIGLGSLGGLFFYLLLKGALHSISVDSFGAPMLLRRNFQDISGPLSDSLLALSVLGIAWGWTRIFQIFLIDDIFTRYRKLMGVVPVYSMCLTAAFLLCTWYFYSNVFPLAWFLFSFGIIYGLIFFFSMKDFMQRVKMQLSRSVEYEEQLSMKTVSIAGGVVLIMGIALPHLIFRTLSFSYILGFFICLWIVSMYMTPGRVFRHIRLYPRYAETPARILNFARYTRKYMMIWFVIVSVYSFILGCGVILDPGFQNPKKNLATVVSALSQTGEALNQYMKENNNYLPSRADWLSGKWLQKLKEKKIDRIPPCPRGGRFVYLKWRDDKGNVVFEIRTIGGYYRRAGCDESYPRFNRLQGILLGEKPGALPDK